LRKLRNALLRQDSLYRFYTLQDDVDRPHLNPANRISPSTMPFAPMTSEDVAAFYSLLDE
jgi:hypothetical protein